MDHPSIVPPDAVNFVLKPLGDIMAPFEEIARAYARNWGIGCALVNVQGHVVAGKLSCAKGCAQEKACRKTRQQATEESVRWGEPSVLLCPRQNALWAVPVMENMHVVGGLLVATPDTGAPQADSAALSPREIRRAMADLLTLATWANLTNPALLELRRQDTQRESARAEAIHELKGHNYQSIRDIYLIEEPALIAAIKAGERATAREILNRMLVGIYFLGRDRPALLKSFLLELVVMMSRSAVEAGGDSTELLGANYSAFAELAGIESEEALCVWLVALLERIMDAINTHHRYPVNALLHQAMTYVQAHLHEDLSRDDVAAIACLSPSHFSRVIKQQFGQSFTELLTRMRVERARELLARTEKSLIQVCMDCGFSEQSYFTKVFQKCTGRTPGEYRRLQRAGEA